MFLFVSQWDNGTDIVRGGHLVCNFGILTPRDLQHCFPLDGT
jgi:hypothetical protein